MSAYSIAGYGEMIADRVRTEAYVRALRQVVNRDTVVVDIGTGTGIFALVACQAGARRVYAIESDDVIEVAREIAAANGFSERIEFIQEPSTRVVLPEKAGVIVSDLHGVLPLYRQLIPSIADARQRLLATGGALIPRSETLWAAIVEAPEIHRNYTDPWTNNPYQLDMERARHLVTNSWSKRRVTPEQVLLPPRIWASLDYGSVTDPDVGGEIHWDVDRPGTADGLVVWFDSVLGEGVDFSNAPGAPTTLYGNAYFPLSRPVPLDKDDGITIELNADLVGDYYVWRWNTRILDKGRADRVKADFRQNSLAGMAFSPQALQRRADDHVARLDENGMIAYAILERMARGMRNDAISREIAAQYPRRYRRWQDALAEVGEMAVKYSR